MNNILQLLYDRFYTPLPMTEDRQEIEQYHRMFIERLDKPERKLVLRIIDAGDRIANELSLDSLEVLSPQGFFRTSLRISPRLSSRATASMALRREHPAFPAMV